MYTIQGLGTFQLKSLFYFFQNLTSGKKSYSSV